MKQVHYGIIGSGVAGLSLAYFLAKKGAKSVLLLEQEKRLGVHASGQNAGMIRQVVPHEAVGRFTQKGAAFLRKRSASWNVWFQPCGSLLLAQGEKLAKLRRAAALAKRRGVQLEWLSVRKAIQKVPLLEGARFEAALFCPTDGIINIHALLAGYFKEAKRFGAEIWMEGKVQRISEERDGTFRIETPRGSVRTDVLINAAGAWVGDVARMVGASSIPFHAYRRHLLLSRPLRGVDPQWPFVWDMTHGIYFRPEGGGFLFSPCDQDRFPAGRCPVNRRLAWKKLRKGLSYFPKFPKVTIRRCWGGLRTFSPDDNFCIGWDGKKKNFFWVAGLDGHGMTTGSAVGEFASDLLLGIGVDSHLVRTFSPARFK